MSELFDDDPREARSTRTSRRPRALLITGVVVVLALIGLTAFAGLYTDRLWYQSAGYGEVFTTRLVTRIGLFLGFGALMGGVVALSIYLAYRHRPLFRPNSREQSNLDRYREVVTPIRTWLVVGIAVVVGAFAGASGMSTWRTFLLWRNGSDTGQSDPYFDRDIGFFLFDLPWWHFVVDFVMATMVIALIAAAVVHYLYGGIRLQVSQDRLSPAAQVQISVLLGVFVLAKGVDYYLDRFDLAVERNGLFTGMNYTGENAVLPAKNILMVVAVICAVLFFLNVWRRTWQLPSVGLALLALSAVLIGMIFPALVQQFRVNPSQADREEPYIQANIDATRSAYDLGDTADATLTPDEDSADTGAAIPPYVLSTTPVIDPRLVSPAFEALQQQQGYYSVAPVLDVDRYEIDDQQRALVLGVRELNQAGLPEGANNWSNLSTVYTHGNGVIAAYANQRDRDDAEADGEEVDDGEGEVAPILWAQGLSGQDDLSQALGDFESRIYYGELSPDYSVVGKASEDDEDVEVNLPVPGSDLGTRTTYEEDGDASAGSPFNRLMFAIRFGEPNFLLSGRVNENSRVLFERDPVTRVERVAPWLTVDADPYPAVVDGRVQWILDGYTTTDRYPNAERESFETMIDDALQITTGLQTLPTDEINYMRNAVKATVDAYTGDVRLYAWDPEDPILQAWMGAFPGTVEGRDQMSAELLEHVRYPEDLFKVQRYQFARYHVTNARDFYEDNGRWAVARDPEETNTFQAPYRLFVGGEEGADFALTSVYLPFGRTNLASFVSVNSDGTDAENYGRLRVLELSNADEESETNQTPGPGQVANEFRNDDAINAALLPLNSNAEVTYGNMLTFPVGGEMMNVQPVYAQNRTTGDAASYPELRYVLVRFGGAIGLGQNLQEALRDAVPTSSTPPPEDPDLDPSEGPSEDPSGGPTGDPGDQTLQEQLDTALDGAVTALNEADAAFADGDLGLYQDKVEEAQDLLGEVADLRNQIREQGGDTLTGAETGNGTDAASSEETTG